MRKALITVAATTLPSAKIPQTMKTAPTRIAPHQLGSDASDIVVGMGLAVMTNLQILEATEKF
jgi:hypothetical protein